MPLLRTSERATFLKCRWLWEREFIDLVKPKTPVPPLRFGSLIHSALAQYYIPGKKRGVKPWLTFEQEYEEQVVEQYKFGFRVDEDEKWIEAGELGPAMLKHYVEHYGKDDRYQVLVSEVPFEVVVHHPRTGRPWFLYVGVMDGVWYDRLEQKRLVVDHKTASSIVLNYLRMDEQATSYWTYGVPWLYANGYLKKSEKLQGMYFNFLRKAMPDVRPTNAQGQYLNKDGSVSLKQPAAFFVRQQILRGEKDMAIAHKRVLQQYQEVTRVKAGLEEAFKTPNQINCRSCWALDICELHEMGQEWEEMRDATTKQWDPYAEHELYDRP